MPYHRVASGDGSDAALKLMREEAAVKKLMVGLTRFLPLWAVLLMLSDLALAQTSTVAINPTQGPPGTIVIGTGTNWRPGDRMQISWDCTTCVILANVTVRSDGTFSASFNVPSNATEGAHTIYFWDIDARYFLVATFTVTRVSALPDLIPTEILYNSADLVSGRTVTFDSGVQNWGTQGTGVFNIRWFVDGVSVGYGSHGGVPANSTVLDGNSAYAWVAAAGTHTITFAVDVDNHVSEANESNNSRSVTVTVISDKPGGKAPNLIVLAHGCCTDANDVKNIWYSFGRLIAGAIRGPGRWEIVVWDWSKNTPTTDPDRVAKAYEAAIAQSLELAIPIAMQPNGEPTFYEYIHLIGHSAGARLIDLAAKRLVNYYKTQEEKKRPFIQLTFLDAYQPNDDDYGNLEGYPKHYAEQYVDRGLPLTDACLSNAFNFDITGWSPLSEEERRWKESIFGHQWPIYWYAESVTIPGFSRYGYPLSFEGGFSEYEELAKIPKHQQCPLWGGGTNCVPAACW